ILNALPDPVSCLTGKLLYITLDIGFSPMLIVAIIVISILLALSALVAAAEVAFFSLDATKLESLKESGSSTDQKILELLNIPKKLIATIVIAHNLVNIGVVII